LTVAEAAPSPDKRSPIIRFPKTISPEPALILRLQTLFAQFFDKQVNLAVLLQKLVTEAAVTQVPDVGAILYNPGHMLLIHLPENWRVGADIRVAALEDIATILERKEAANPLVGAYGEGFEEFALISGLMGQPDTHTSLESVWSGSPRSEQDRERMRYLLLRPIEQAEDIRNLPSACQQEINRFVDDVRAGKRVPALAGLTETVKPTRFIRHENELFLALGESVLARYYVLAQFQVSGSSCSLKWQRPMFAM
jgi:hypothetical protein